MPRTIFFTILLSTILLSCNEAGSSAGEEEKAPSPRKEQPGKNTIVHRAKQAPARGISKKYIGTFSAGVETEATTTGMAGIDYTFTVTGGSAQVETNTYHEPIRCNGKYKAVENNGLLELYYTGSEEFCDTEKPLFFLKEEKGKLYAKGLGGEGTYNEWIRLERE